jgi:hypothetical protein
LRQGIEGLCVLCILCGSTTLFGITDFFQPREIFGPVMRVFLAEAIERVPGIDPDLVAVVQDDGRGVPILGLDRADLDAVLARWWLVERAHLGGPLQDRQILARQLESSAVIEGDAENAGFRVELDLDGMALRGLVGHIAKGSGDR